MGDMPEEKIQKLSKREKFSLILLCCLNILIYVDRYCASYVEYEIKKTFAVSGNWETAYTYANMISYCAAAPVFGYLGDRYSRRILLIFSVACWIFSHFISSFSINYRMFILLRAFVGIGQSGYVNIAPSVLASIVFHEERTIILALFYVGIPFGSGCGFLLGSQLTSWLGWPWTFRSTIFIGLAGMLLLYYGEYPERGQKEAAAVGKQPAKATSYIQDLKSLIRNKPFILITVGYTCTCFVTGSTFWWGTEFLQLGFEVISQKKKETVNYSSTVYATGIIFTLAGIFGVLIGSTLSYFQRRIYPTADTVICGLSLIVSWPFITISLYTTGTNKLATFIFMLVGQTILNFNWAILVDMLFYVVIPVRHATCLSITVVFSYLFAEMLSNSIINALMDYFIRLSNNPYNWFVHSHKYDDIFVEGADNPEVDTVKFISLQMSLFTVISLQLVGGAVFLVNKRFIIKYREKADNEMIAPITIRNNNH